MSADEVIRRFESIKAPTKAQQPSWESPYRLLGGAAYSIACARIAERKAANHDMPEDLPNHWWEAVKRQIRTGGNQDPTEGWVHVWQASFMLTNAVFRISAATEKVLSVTGHFKTSHGRSGENQPDYFLSR